jgi:fatty acid-binding protein DegV
MANCYNAIMKNQNLDSSADEIHILEFDSASLADELEKIVAEQLPGLNIVRSQLSINVCAHAGPGTVGLGCCKKW